VPCTAVLSSAAADPFTLPFEAEGPGSIKNEPRDVGEAHFPLVSKNAWTPR